MSQILKIKKDMEFYSTFSSLTKAVKAVAISQFHTLEEKIRTFEKFIDIVVSFFWLIDLKRIEHPFINPQGRPTGVIAITSESGLLGGLNHKIIIAALNYLKGPHDKLIVIGFQGRNFAQGYHVPFTAFPGIEDEYRYSQALQLRDYIFGEVLTQKIGPVKVIYPYAPSITIQQVVMLDMLPCSEWVKESSKKSVASDVLMESNIGDIIEYLAYLWIGQKLYEIFGFSRLAELSARITHMEGCTQRIEQLEKQMNVKYHKARHQIIDQQLRELFAARSLYGKRSQ